MPVLQVILIEALNKYRHYRDEAYKLMYLPYLEAMASIDKLSGDERKALREKPTALFVAFLPRMAKVYEATIRLDRRVAALRCIEAVRLHAAANNGKLPQKLTDIKMVPVPTDPATGRAFVYQVQGDRVTLRDPPRPNGQPALSTPLHYEITFKR
jgi:hypothetical protein